ncbi:MAG: GDSL-type esterase/lipase family protein, partial [Nitriliruptoraceae bacterium]
MTTSLAGPRTTVLGSFLLVLVLALSALTGASTASADEHIEAPAPYLALGDSLPYGWDPVTPPFPLVTPDFHVGYPEIYAELADLTLTNASCPGETSGSFLDRDTPDNGCGVVIASQGLKVDYGTGAQLGFAVDFLTANPDTELVSIQLGANDLFRCQDAEGGCTPDAFEEVLGTLGGNLATALGTLRTVYDGEIIVVSYYALDYSSEEDLAIAGATDQVVSGVVASFEDVVVADGSAALAPAAARAAGSTCDAGLLLDNGDGTCDVHPTDRGHRLMAQALAEARTGSYLVCPAAPSASIDANVDADVVGVHADAITCALEYGMVQGFTDGTFGPRTTITRGQAATFVRNYLEIGLAADLEEPGELPFDDIADSTHAQNIAA